MAAILEPDILAHLDPDRLPFRVNAGACDAVSAAD